MLEKIYCCTADILQETGDSSLVGIYVQIHDQNRLQKQMVMSSCVLDNSEFDDPFALKCGKNDIFELLFPVF